MSSLQRTYVHPPTLVQASANARHVMPLIGAFYGVGKCRLLPGFDPYRGLWQPKCPFLPSFCPCRDIAMHVTGRDIGMIPE